jgi:23S rRNA (cytosine1962-C5)-methyltransferase
LADSDFSNRLKKNFLHFKKWAKRGSIDCFRVYNLDVPEFPFAVDVYGDAVVLHEYLQFDNEQHKSALALEAVLQILGSPRENVFVKSRRRILDRTNQYGASAKGSERVVQEGVLRFAVDLEKYTDTGLFLDHRPLRKWLVENCKGKRVLNLFSYTGSLSCAAGKGGADMVASVDMSNTYLEWAMNNWKLNTLSFGNGRFVRADCMAFLQVPPAESDDGYDIVLIDPPSFSNSKKMEGTFDVQRDHVPMLQAAQKFLRKDAQIIFSNNLGSFRLDKTSLEPLFTIEDWTKLSTPEDFKGSKPHVCFRLKVR